MEKKYALKCYDKAIQEGANPDDIIKGSKNYALYCKQKETPQEYIKHPSTWLNKGCWDDEYELKKEETIFTPRVGETMTQAKERAYRHLGIKSSV